MLITSVTMEIENYDKWKSLYDQFSEARKSMGSTGGRILRDQHSKKIQVIVKWSNPEKARKFHESEGLQNAMKQAGMIGLANIDYYESEELCNL